MTSRQREFEALLRNDLRAFIEKVFTALSPGQRYVWSWHIDAIAYQLQRVLRGEICRLIINMPPRSLKSIAASVAFPAFVLGQDPTRRIICVSYSGDLAKKHSNDFRAILEAPWYRSLFPNTRIGTFKNTETEIELTERGNRLATSVGGTLTGRGGHLIIIDDPLKPDDAMSETKRTSANLWFNTTLLSRLDDKRTGAIIVVMQRVHMDDLTGFLLKQSDQWEVLCLPAVADIEQIIPLSSHRYYRRPIGEALSPEREPLEVLEGLKSQLGSYAFAAQYQQSPIPPGGAMINPAWIGRYTEAPREFQRRMILQSWDTANKGGPNNDWSVCTTWTFGKDRKCYLIDVFRRQLDYPALKAHAQRLAKNWSATRVLIEDTGVGTSLIQELKGRVSGVIAVKPEGDKESRMAAVSAKFEAGEVLFPESAPWLADLEAELFAFPVGRYDDQVDSISQALSQKLSFMAWLTREDWDRAIAEARRPLVIRSMGARIRT